MTESTPAPKKKPSVTVIIPTMNEEEGIGKTLDQVPQPKDMDLNVMVVDTDSKDKTKEIARSKGATVINESRRGYGRAYKTGFEKATGDVIVTLDADCTYPAETVPELVWTLIKDDLDFITTNRFAKMKKGAMSRKHRFGNWVLNVTTRLLFGVKIKDSQSGMWVFKRSILSKIELVSDGMPMSEELKIEAYKKGFKCAELPIEYRPRVGEVKLSSWKDGWKNFKFLWSKRFGKARSRSKA
jgi:glycosyltransferase involved in cell wall biosynthesis